MNNINKGRDIERAVESLRTRATDAATRTLDAVDVIDILRMLWKVLEMIGDGLESMGGAFDGIDLGL